MIACKRKDCVYHRGDILACHAPNIMIDENGKCQRYYKAKEEKRNIPYERCSWGGSNDD